MKRVYAAYAVLGGMLWPLPLLNVLQVESAAVVAFVSFFLSGWSAVNHFQEAGAELWRELGRQEMALSVPLGMLTVSQIWAPNCTFGQGLLFYALFPGVTVVFAVALAYAITGTALSRPFWVLGGVGVVVGLSGPVYDLGFHPQLYTYNHVFGGVLGPIYDEQLAVRWGLFSFRGLTVLWAAAAALLGARLRKKGPRWGLPVCALFIGAVYWFSAPLGINTPARYLQEQLGGHLQTAHFDLYYDPSQLETPAVEALADDHEAYYASIRERLSIETGNGPDRIQSYLYPSREVKARLTGARSTSVTPVWLDRPQVHLLVDRVEASLGHELAHVFSRPYGLPLLQASWAPGLVEGWAVALEPPDPYPAADDLVGVATMADSVRGLSTTADAIADRLTPWGFWTGRSAVSYAAMGSFVGYLLETYGPGPLKSVYARGDFEAVYGRSLDTLAAGWARTLRSRPFVERAAHDVVFRQFTTPSLFEKECPHYVPPHRRHLQAARRAGRRDDSAAVGRHLQEALDAAPRYEAAHAALAQRRLARGAPDPVRTQLDTLGVTKHSVGLQLLLGDALVLTGRPDAARRHYRRARVRAPHYAHDTRTRLLLRRAVADRPAMMTILANGRAPLQQARQLVPFDSADAPAVQAWRALRLQAAHRYARADSLWRQLGATSFREWPRAWRQAWVIQRRAWHSVAAYRSGKEAPRERAGALARAGRLARTGARMAGARGAREWAGTLRARAQRAEQARMTEP
jgi:hypothetical protein